MKNGQKKWVWIFSSMLLLKSLSLQSEENYLYDGDILILKSTSAGYRDYYQPVNDDKKKAIRFILKTMAKKSLTSLWSYKSQLEDAGRSIDQVHPLRFLQTVFTDEELKAYFHQIKKRASWIWGEFIKGLKTSLQEELNIDNLKDVHIYDFAMNVNIDPTLIYELILYSQWEEFINILLQYVPREGQFDRYDM
ncbi:MAG TPA: hypothetical protein VIH61_05960 [Waddliaceae bacterium]